jgi:hypothetical protein
VLDSAGYAHPRGYMTISTDSAREVLQPQVFDTDVPDSVFRGIAPLVRDLVPRWPGTGPILMAFRLDRADVYREMAGPSVVDSAARALATQPVLRNPDQVRDLMFQALAAHPNLAHLEPGIRNAVVSLLIGADGTVALANVYTSTGDPAMDAYIPGVALRMRFEPARAGRTPIPVFVCVPFALEVRR